MPIRSPGLWASVCRQFPALDAAGIHRSSSTLSGPLRSAFELALSARKRSSVEGEGAPVAEVPNFSV
jgi:hypothetical protein